MSKIVCPNGGKICHTKQEAEELAVKLLKLEGRVLYLYPCRLCRSWHLTKKKMKLRKMPKKPRRQKADESTVS